CAHVTPVLLSLPSASLRGRTRAAAGGQLTGRARGVFHCASPPPTLGRGSNANDGSLTSTLKTLLVFTALMITLPIGLYFSSKSYVFEGAFGMSNRDSYFYAAIVAVVAVHMVLGLFVYAAWNEGTRQWREGKQD
uniref:Vacuolar ATPase assembly integral membrane protein VMA21 n=2 Tax=Sarcophilus harrisii TaxID=9305 RepID=G3W4E7_SARHA